MLFRRLGCVAALAAAVVIEISCGQVYRPVVIPIDTTPPDPSSFHAVFAISNNAAFNPGSALQIDVAGDTNIGVANMGVNPTHAGAVPNNSRIFVASAGSALGPGNADIVTAFTPASDSSTATGLGNPTVFTLPAGSLPVFVNTTQSSEVFVANFGTNSVSGLSAITNAVNLTGNVGANPVALAETLNNQHLYVANQADGTVTDLSPTDLTTQATIAVGNKPVWAVARKDSRRVYVITQGDGQLVAIDTATDTVLPSQTNLSVGAGANFVLYDPNLGRLYVTNPLSGSVYVFSTTGGVDSGGNANDTPTLLGTIAMNGGANPPCANTCSPVSVAALPDGSRFYVASYQLLPSCPDSNVGAGTPCIIPMLTVFQAASLAQKPISGSLLSPSISLLSSPQYSATQYALPVVAACTTAATYSPSSTRFRMFATAAADSSHVYVSLCDGGSVADVAAVTTSIATGTNNPDTLITNVNAPFGTCTSASCLTTSTITGFSISGNVVTFAAANQFVPGEKVVISGLTTGTYLNGTTLRVIATGLSTTQFEANFTYDDVTLTADSGTAVPLPPLQTPLFLLTGQ